MAVKTVYVSKLGTSYKLSDHFTLGEFQCKNGADKVLYSPSLITKLEALRTYLGDNCTIGINSGYRTPAYNVSIGGASKSKHTEGVAADIKVRVNGEVVPAKYICCICQDLGFKGIAMIKGGTSTHVDMRTTGTYRGDETYGYTNNVGSNFYKYFGISSNEIAALKAKTATEEIVEEVEEAVSETEDEDMVKYKTYEDIPTWYQEAVKKLIDAGYIKGTGDGELNISEIECRIYTVLNRASVI